MYFLRSSGTRSLKIKLPFNPSRSPATRQSRRCCSLFSLSKWTELLAPAVNAATRSSTCSSTCPQTLQSFHKASYLALNFNIACAFTMKPGSCRQRVLCTSWLSSLLTQNSHLACPEVNGGRDADTLPAELRHDPCALAKEGLVDE